jgi:hypothetical protein
VLRDPRREIFQLSRESPDPLYLLLDAVIVTFEKRQAHSPIELAKITAMGSVKLSATARVAELGEHRKCQKRIQFLCPQEPSFAHRIRRVRTPKSGTAKRT